jgi:hypothetical protein
MTGAEKPIPENLDDQAKYSILGYANGVRPVS